MPIPDYVQPQALVPGHQQNSLRVFTEPNKDALIAAVMGDGESLPVTIRMAAGLAGLSFNTVDTWMKQGQLELQQWEWGVVEKKTELAEFSQYMTILETRYKAKLIQATWDQARKDTKGLTWQAFVTLAERLYPSEYGQMQRIEQTTTTTNTDVKITWHRVDGNDWTDRHAPIPGLPATEALPDAVDITFSPD